MAIKTREHIIDQSFKTAQIRLQQLAQALPVRSDLHIARKIWHAAMGTLLVSIYAAGMAQGLAVTLLTLLLMFNLVVETMRLKNPVFNERVLKIFGPVFRHSEITRYSTVPYYLAAALFAIAIFPKPIAILSLLYLAWGDPASSFFGVLFKGRSVKIFNNKSLHGSAAGFAVCATITYFYLQSGGMSGLTLLRLTLLGGFAGSLAEAIPLDIDDNFTIPVVSGLIMWAGFLVIQFV